jgi:hypothetical protein
MGVLTAKEMIVILAIAAGIFKLARPIAKYLGTDADFTRRRNVWFILTATAFLSPSFWLYAIVAIPLLTWARRRDTNPIALYLLMLHVIPPIEITVPVVGINALFDLDNYRLLSFVILIPISLRSRDSANAKNRRGFRLIDALLLGWGILQAAQFIPPDLANHALLQDSFTNVLRRIFLFLLDVYVLYFAVSRSVSNRPAFLDVLGAFCLACALMSLIACFEFIRHWLLYGDLAAHWGADPGLSMYLMRGEALRARASAGHPLALGYLVAIGSGFWLYLRSHVPSLMARRIVTLLFWAGLFAAYSRGPWVGAAAIYFAFALLGPRALPKLLKAFAISAVAASVIIISPLGKQIIDVLPFMGGSIDSGSVPYRQRLAEESWQIVKNNPFFGDSLAYQKMGDLRQGEGIIDFVDTYAQVAVFRGCVGLALFIGPLLVGSITTYRRAKEKIKSDPELAMLGVCLCSCTLGALLMLTSSSFILGCAEMFYVLAGLTAAFSRLATHPPLGAPDSSITDQPLALS